MDKIEKFLDEEIRPELRKHNGDISIEEYDKQNRKLVLRLMGQCCTCPHSIDTSENFIKISVREKFPEIEILHVNAGASKEFIEIVKAYLRGK